MWWGKIGQSSFVTRAKSATKYSVISAISDNDIEALAISKQNTNKIVFLNFLEILVKSLLDKYSNQKNKLILWCDGAKYHLVKDVHDYLAKKGIIMIQNIPYTPEFSAIEIYIDWVKNKIRRMLRKSK